MRSTCYPSLDSPPATLPLAWRASHSSRLPPLSFPPHSLPPQPTIFPPAALAPCPSGLRTAAPPTHPATPCHAPPPFTHAHPPTHPPSPGKMYVPPPTLATPFCHLATALQTLPGCIACIACRTRGGEAGGIRGRRRHDVWGVTAGDRWSSRCCCWPYHSLPFASAEEGRPAEGRLHAPCGRWLG